MIRMNSCTYLLPFKTLMRGFDFCRLVVMVDGAHLSGAYKETFVSASMLDGGGII